MRMIFLHRIPFIRILLPFIIGIGFYLIAPNDAPSLGITLSIYVVCMLLYFLLIKKSKDFTKILFGVLLQVFLFLSGWQLCNYNNDKQNVTNYGNYSAEDIERELRIKSS